MTYPSLKTWTAVHAYGMKTITKNSSPNIRGRKETNHAIALSLLSKIVFTYKIFATLSVICYEIKQLQQFSTFPAFSPL